MIKPSPPLPPHIDRALRGFSVQLANRHLRPADRARMIRSFYRDLRRRPPAAGSGRGMRRLAARSIVDAIYLAQGLAPYLEKINRIDLLDRLNRHVHRVFIEDVPPNPNHTIVLANLVMCNLDMETIQAGYRGYRTRVAERGTRQFFYEPQPELYMFEKPRRGLINVPIGFDGNPRLPLNLALYGFPDDLMVSLRPMRMGNPPTFSQEQTAVHERLLGMQTIGLNQLLEAAGAIVNRSMTYDIAHLPDPQPLSAYPGVFSRERLAEACRPRGDETLLGQCGEAGRYIRRLLLSLQPSNHLLISVLNTYAKGFHHDVTLAYDTTTHRWAPVNSRSPLKPYNLIPRDRLFELGAPFHAR